MSEPLSGIYKELWIEYQNQEQADINSLSAEQLIDRVKKWEAIEFEARSKRQKCNAKIRELKGPAWNPETNLSNIKPKGSEEEVNYKPKVRRTKEEKLADSVKGLGIDLSDLLGDIKAKKTEGVRVENQAPNGKVK
jgi:hypothetical protein